nr:DegT/DnrJ/EryC1/StrS family aminotransferase [Candidatus Omnitrophota bacterium]
CPDIEKIRDICRKSGIYLIEDCAHAIGAAYKGAMAGSFGLAGCFSFYPTKVMTTGTGGLLVTDDPGLASYAKSLRLHGAGGGLSEIVNIGNDWFMDEIRSAIGLNQIMHLKDFLKKRAVIAGVYDSLIAKTDLIWKFEVSESCVHAYYKYPVQVTADIDVQALKDRVKAKCGFELESIYWPPCHKQPVYKKIFKFNKRSFPAAESVLSQQITLPMHAVMKKEDARYAFDCVVCGIKRGRRA